MVTNKEKSTQTNSSRSFVCEPVSDVVATLSIATVSLQTEIAVVSPQLTASSNSLKKRRNRAVEDKYAEITWTRMQQIQLSRRFHLVNNEGGFLRSSLGPLGSARSSFGEKGVTHCSMAMDSSTFAVGSLLRA